MAKKGKIEINSELCKGCKHCANICPKSCLELTSSTNSKAYHYIFQARPEDCIACKLCAYACPDGAIEVYAEY